MMRAILMLLLLGVSPAWAEGDPECGADLAAVDASFDETLQRLETAFKTNDKTQRCDAIRHHIEVMEKSAEVFSRCTFGRAREENLGQAYGTIADFQDIASEIGCP